MKTDQMNSTKQQTILAAINDSWKKVCTIFPGPENFNPLSALPSILLDTYCEKRAFHRFTRNALSESIKEYYYAEHSLSASKKTSYKNIDVVKYDVKNIEPPLTYAEVFLKRAIPSDTSTTSLQSYNAALLAIIITKWKNIPFNTRFIHPTLATGRNTISPKQYPIFLELNKLASHLKGIEKLIYNHLTDHYFNINLFSLFVNHLKNHCSEKDYTNHLSSFMGNYELFLFAILSLPTWELKLQLWDDYCKYIQSAKEADYTFSEYILNVSNIILQFSILWFPNAKRLFWTTVKHALSAYSEIDEDDIYDVIKNELEANVSTYGEYPDYTNVLADSLNYISKDALEMLTKLFYSIPVAPPYYLSDSDCQSTKKVTEAIEDISDRLQKLHNKPQK